MTEHKHYLSAGGMVFAMQITRSGNLAQGGSTKPQESLQYLHTDHLGSVAVVTDDTGSVSERLAFDPWGKRRFPNGTADVNDTIVGSTIDRGFTMHEHLDEMGLIHMNGRIYDPLIGRFMSADPFIQAPENLQSHNRFAYVMNNPLSYTDPSGYFSLKKFFRTILAIAAVVVLGPGGYAPFFSGTGLAAGLGNAALAGFVSGAIQTGTLKGAINGAFSGVLFFGVGQFVPGPAGRLNKVVGHAVAGCVSSVAAGGSCRSGAIAAGFAEGITPYVPKFDSLAARVAVRAIVGGIGSKLAGGKFEDGAIQGAFGYLFNQVAHPDDLEGVNVDPAAEDLYEQYSQSRQLLPHEDIIKLYGEAYFDTLMITAPGSITQAALLKAVPFAVSSGGAYLERLVALAERVGYKGVAQALVVAGTSLGGAGGKGAVEAVIQLLKPAGQVVQRRNDLSKIKQIGTPKSGTRIAPE